MRPDPRDLPVDTLAELLDREGISPEALRDLMTAIHPVDLANLLEDLDARDRARLLTALHPQQSAQVVHAMDPASRTAALAHVDDTTLAALAQNLAADVATDIAQALPQRRRERLLAGLPAQLREQVRQLGHYAPHTAGGLMNPAFVALPPTATAREARATIQRVGPVEALDEIYVVDPDRRLLGRFPLHALFAHDDQARIETFMDRDVRSVPYDLDQEEVARLVTDFALKSVPVVDRDGRLLGVVTVDDVIDVIHQEASEDLHRIAGGGAVHPVQASPWLRFRVRAPWLAVLMIIELAIAVLVRAFEETLARAVTIASFIPVIMAMGGGVGMQASTNIVRGLATGQATLARGLRIVVAETTTGLLFGLASGAVAFALAWAIHGATSEALSLAYAVGLALTTALTVASLWGSLVPLALQRMRIDPAVAARPFITGTNDMVGILIYLVIAAWMVT